jgi:hypothetical protein
MSEFMVGIPMGMAIGIAIGINLGKYKKSWSELTEREKRNRKIILVTGIIILSSSALVGLYDYLTF